MTISVKIPKDDGYGIPVFWSNGGRIAIKTSSNLVTLSGTKTAMLSIAKQLLYFSCNDLPPCTHVHYDSFFCGSGWSGPSLMVEIRDIKSLNVPCQDEEIPPSDMVVVSENVEECIWDPESTIKITTDKYEVGISGNRTALLSIAKKIYSLCFFGATEPSYCYYNSLDGWQGESLYLQVLPEE